MPFYTAFHLNIESEISLPAFTKKDRPQHIDVSIRLTKSLPSPKYISPVGTGYEYLSEREIIIGWPALGYFKVKDGCSITICPAQGVDPQQCTLPLFGLVFAALLQQRQEYVLHGSAVVVNGRGAVFIGDKGYGKSTMASWLMSEGAEVVTDDMAAFFLDQTKWMLRPGFPQMKLWPSSLEIIGRSADDFTRVIPEMDKRTLAIESFHDRPVEVGGIFILAQGDSVAVRRLALQESLLGLSQNMMGCGLVEAKPQFLVREIFEQGAALLQTVPVYELTRPQDLSLLGKAAELVRKSITVR